MTIKIQLKSPPTLSCGAFPTTWEFTDISGIKYYFYYRYGNWEFCYDDYDRTEIASGLFGDNRDGECTWEDASKAMLSKGYEILITQ